VAPAPVWKASAVEEDPFSDRLKRLEERLRAAETGRAEPPPRGRREFTQGSLAWRMVTELVVGMLLGVAIGYGLDSLFGTLPVFLALFAVLGFAGGVRTMMRTADEVRKGRGEAARMGGPGPGNGRNGQGKE
jgi:ATP synthase protein I